MIGVVELGLQLRTPLALLLAMLVPALWWWRRRLAVFAEVAVGAAFLAGPLPQSVRTRLSALPSWCEGVGVALLVVALARPVWVASEPPSRLGRDVLLCFDRSSSMAEEDLEPGRSRLSVGKELAREFLRGRRDDRLGIVAFARYADLVCPPTRDHAAVLELIERVQLVAAEGPEDATAIGAAVAMAANLLTRDDPGAGKVVVLLTDGEENVATAGAPDEIAPLHAGQWCRGRGIRVYTIALGRGVRRGDGSYAPLDASAVQQLAKLTGGRFFAAADAAALRAVYTAIDRLEAVRFAEPGVRVAELYAAPTLLGLLLLLLAQLWRHGRMGVAA